MLEFRDAVLADHQEESVYFDGTPPVLARVECRSCRQKWPCDAYRLAAEPVPLTLDARECECVPGHRCDCQDLRSLLERILMNAEYPKMEAEGLAAAALGLRWSEQDDRYVRAALTEPKP